MDVLETIRTRRSVREFTRDPVAEPILSTLFDAAVHAPNAINEQPWEFTVVRDPVVLETISVRAKAHALATLPAGSVPAPLRGRLEDPTFQIFYHAPVLIVISGAGPSRWVVEDCTLAAENLMLAACSMGLGTCWIGFAQGYLNTTEGKGLIGLPASSVVVAPIIVGHPQAASRATPRAQPTVRWIG